MAQFDTIKIIPGELISYQGANFTIEKVLDLNSILIKSLYNSKLVSVPIKEINPPISDTSINNSKQEELSNITEKDWEEAQKRFMIIKPIIENQISGRDIVLHAQNNGIHYTTIYRWLKKYFDRGERVIALLDYGPRGGKGKVRLNDDVEQIITAAIEKVYLTKQRNPIKKVYLEVYEQCKNQNVDPPHLNTVRNRVKNIREEKSLTHRYGKDHAKNKFEPLKGHFPQPKQPLSIIQIDHTKVDIILIDEIERKPIGRPWITMAIDVYSRMVVGLYLSFDPPGALGTGMCISHAILPKEVYLNKINVEGDWPCWGVMQVLHMDNAKEFRGLMLERACRNYNIELNWRPVKTPNWGGHIERLLGTFAKEIHTLPGTTFSNSKERDNYESEKEAVFTIKEFENWLVTLIVKVYHQRIHSTIGVKPIDKYKEGIFGSSTQPAMGLPNRIFNERKVKLDFMPFVERTIQEYGVIIDHIFYYDDILRRWIHTKQDNSPKNQSKKKFIFKRDPRDISVIYFYDPELKEYFEIPYRDMSHPPITLWEYNEVLRRLTNAGFKNIDESSIFEAYKELQQIEENAKTKTALIKKRKNHAKKLISKEKSLKEEVGLSIKNDTLIDNEITRPINIKPFEEIDDGTPFS